jgi:hypothetical protein
LSSNNKLNTFISHCSIKKNQEKFQNGFFILDIYFCPFSKIHSRIFYKKIKKVILLDNALNTKKIIKKLLPYFFSKNNFACLGDFLYGHNLSPNVHKIAREKSL